MTNLPYCRCVAKWRIRDAKGHSARDEQRASVADAGKPVFARPAVLAFVLSQFFTGNTLQAAGDVLVPPDSNTGITVVNAESFDGAKQVFFLSWPNLGDPNSGKDCGLNYYRVAIRPGEQALQAVPVAREVCSSLNQKSRLLNDGSALIITSQQLEQWKEGTRLRAYPFRALPAVTRQGIVNDVGGPAMLGISSAGHVVAVMHNTQGSLDVVSLDPLGEEAWRGSISLDGLFPEYISVEGGADGGALIVITRSGLSAGTTDLHVFDRSGARNTVELAGNESTVRPEDMENMSPEQMQSVFMAMAAADPVVVEQVSARARRGGGYDVLYRLDGGDAAARGLYLLRLSSSGGKESERFLGLALQDIGLDEWADFEVAGTELRISGRVLAVQEGVEARRDRYMQNVVSRIDLETGRVDSRLVPLDRQFLEAAMNAGDAEIQYLPGLPGGEPVLLTSAGSRPVDVTIGIVARRSVLRINEVNDELVAWSPELDQRRQAELEAASQPDPADQAAQMNQHMQSLADGSFFEAQIAEMEKALDDPNLSPEQRRQFEQIIEQMRKSMTGKN